MAIAIKFAVLAIRGIAKPIAKQFSNSAQKSDQFKGVLSRVGRTINQVTGRANAWLLRMTTDNQALANIRVKGLNEEEAVKTGAEFLSEFGLIMLALGLYSLEQLRKDGISAEKKAKEERLLALARREEIEYRDRVAARLDLIQGEILVAKLRAAAETRDALLRERKTEKSRAHPSSPWWTVSWLRNSA